MQPAFDFAVREGETVQPLCGVALPESTAWQQVWRRAKSYKNDSGVNDLLRDGDWLWVATPQDVVRLNLDTLECTRFTSVDGSDEMLTGVQVLLAGPEGRVWAARYGELYLFDGKSWRFVQLDREDFHGLAFDAEGNLWTDNSVYRGKDEVRRYSGHEPPSDEVWEGESVSLSAPLDCNKWFASDDFRQCFDVQSTEDRRLLLGWYKRLDELGTSGIIGSSQLPLIAAESNDRLWMRASYVPDVGDRYSALLNFDGKIWQVLPWPYGSTDLLIADDARGGVWAGTDEGLVFSDGQSFRRYPLSPADVIPSITEARHLAVDADGRLWVGAWDDDLLLYDEASGTWQPTVGTRPSRISTDDRGGLWAVWKVYTSYGGSISYFDGEVWTHHRYPRDWSHYPRQILADEGGVWLSFTEHALWHFDGEAWEEYSTGTQSDRLTRGPQGEIYAMGEDRILRRFDGTAWQPVLPPPRDGRFRISHELVRDIVVGPEGDVWVALDAVPSLFVYRGSGWEKVFAPTEGEITALLIDSRGNLWAGHRHGLLRYDGQSWESMFSETDWVLDLAEDHEGRIWVARSDGLYVYDPARE